MKYYNEKGVLIMDLTHTTNEWKDIEMNVFFATDPKLNPVKQVAKETLSQTLSRLSIELKSIKQGISKL